jgi:hypothetical protein
MTDWNPPACPEEAPDARFAQVPASLAGGGIHLPTPTGLADAEAIEIGSLWRTTLPACIVVVKWYGSRQTLALLLPSARPNRYTLSAGTRLRLVAAYDPSRDPKAAHLDGTLYYQFLAGHGYRGYQILDGPSAGRRVDLPAGHGPFWLPPSALAAHISLADSTGPL